MYKIPGTTYYIDKEFNVLTSSGNICYVPTRLYKNHKQIIMNPFGINDWYDVEWLYVCSVYGIENKECFLETRMEKVPYTRFGHPYFVYHKRPVYYNSEYRYVPGFCMLAVSKDGRIINTNTNTIIEGHICKGYRQLTINCMREHGNLQKKNITFHRLIALAWVANTNAQLHSVVNHIDGNKLNNAASNLEWVTPKDNSNHAVKIGIDSKSAPCKLRNVENGEIIEFPSQQKAAEFLGLKANAASLTVNRQINYLFNDIYEFRSSTDTRPWFYENVECIPGGSRSQYVFRITKADGKVVIVNGINRTLSYVGSNKKGHTFIPYDVITECNKYHPDWSIEFIDLQTNNNTPIEVRNESTGEIKEFKNIQAVMKFLKVSGNKGIRRSLANNGARIYNGYRFRYKSEDNAEWPTCNTAYTEGEPKKLLITYFNSDKKVKCKSLREASRLLGISGDAIRRIIRRRLPSDTYTIEYID